MNLVKNFKQLKYNFCLVLLFVSINALNVKVQFVFSL